MRCPFCCAQDTKVVDSRLSGDGDQVRRRRRCTTCGERFTTYAIRAQEDSGIISINGAAAHKANPGDRVIICTYAVLSQQEAAVFKPTLIYLDADNRIKDMRHAIPVQVA